MNHLTKTKNSNLKFRLL